MIDERKAVLALKDAFDKKFAGDILVLDLIGKTILCDYFVLATAQNQPHITALVEVAHETLAPLGFTHRHTEGTGGTSGAKWVLMDFGDIIVHIFDSESRAYYGLERIWADAAQV